MQLLARAARTPLFFSVFGRNFASIETMYNTWLYQEAAAALQGINAVPLVDFPSRGRENPLYGPYFALTVTL